MPMDAEKTAFEAFPQLDAGTHGGCIVQMQVTRDGQSLISAGETTLRVWDLSDAAQGQPSRLKRLLLGRVNGPTDDGAIDGRAARFATSHDSRWLVALKPWRHRFAGSPGPQDRTQHDAGRVTEVQVFDLNSGNLQSRFVHPGQLLDLDFSPDGRWLAAVGNVRVGAAGSTRQAGVWVWSTRELLRPGARVAPKAHAQLQLGRTQRASTVPAALRFVPPGHAYGPTPERGQKPDRDAASLVLAIGDDAGVRSELAWLRFAPTAGLTLTLSRASPEPITPSTLAVSATTVAIGAMPPSGRKLRGRLFCFAHADPTNSSTTELEAPAASAAFSPSGDRLAVGLMVDPVNGGDAPAGTQTVQVNVYDCSYGTRLALRSSYFGHDDNVRALAFTDNQTIASAGGDNQAIHFWRPQRRIAEAFDAIRGVGRVAIEPGITADERVLFGTVPPRLLPPGHAMRQQSFDLRRMQLSTSAASVLRRDFESRKWWVGDGDDMVIPLWFIGDDAGRGDPTDFVPDLSLFVGADDAWVIWTSSGYYNAGGGDDAAKRIGYRINRALHQEGLLVPSDRFKAFYRPEIVQAVVRHGSEARARAHGVDVPEVDVTCILPPIAELARNGLRQTGRTVGFNFTVETPCADVPPTRASLLRNGRVVWMNRAEDRVGTTGKPLKRIAARQVVPPLPLLPGRNRFAFHVENKEAKSVPVEFEIDGPVAVEGERESTSPGRLFLLSVGVAKFKHPDKVPELKCADRDARAVFNAFAHGDLAKKAAAKVFGQGSKAVAKAGGAKRLGNQAFDKVDAKLLLNADATKAAILSELDRMCALIAKRHARFRNERDVLFVFLSGHGLKAMNKKVPSLFFSNHDLLPTPEDTERTGLSMLDLGDRITSVPAEVVLVIDACHAGLAGRGTMAGLNAEELARRVHAIHERGMYLVTAARAEELASEDGASMLGVLTAAMLEALERSLPNGVSGVKGLSGVKGGRGRASKTAGGAARSKRNLEVLMADIVAGVQRFVPVVSARTGVDPQTPVCRIYGDLTPLTILKT
jgi:WD40 repeat protein